ncbi:MAG TPA: DUF1697 domain-containing protein [Acidimicrobiales bacterium]|jgi:uncharacterized protein (DUF1697 family)|nr:DUF1697 domain-containing protein [Acidimicrobiales bacterium]
MPTYVAMLRSVNVSGRNRLAMDQLRALVAAAGFADVATYVQSGNVVLSGRGSPRSVGLAIAEQMTSDLGWSVPVLVRTKAELEAVLELNPFVRRGVDPKTLHVTFLADEPDPQAADALNAGHDRSGDDRVMVVDREAYLHCPGGYGRTKLNNTYLERRLGGLATTRNWRTVTALAGMAGIEV